MAHPVTWAKKKFFYPIGNTPPSSFTSDLDAETPAAILLLGCGDPRSILYTIYSEPTASRGLDFTCCDAEPAILARNVLLLSMILNEDCNENRIKGIIWNIFFHLFLDKSSLGCLREQCQRLADLSISLESWEKGKYSNLLRFCTTHTLMELHRQWCLYAMPDDTTKKSRLWNAFQMGMQEVRNRFAASRIYTAGRSAGPAWNSVLQPGQEQYRRYWNTGVTFDDVAQISAAIFVNPAFAYDSSGQDFNVHYGTDPILAFHLAMVTTLPQFTKRDPSVSELFRIAKEQFKDWCLAFKKRIEDGPANIVIRLWAGDALAFSRALLVFANSNSTDTGVYPSAWEATPIILDGRDYSGATQDKAPLKFDIIDTSNLFDHLGLINILVATVPLLQDHPAATLYTNSLLNFDRARGKFASRACTEIATLSLLLGIIPASYVSGFTAQSNMHDVCTSISATISSCQETVSWKGSSTDSLLQIAAKPLGSILFNLYLRMFRDDDILSLFNIEVQPRVTGVIHYDRSSFAFFLALVKQRIHSDWTQVMEYTLSSIERDKTLLMGLNNVQDLYCQLHIHGVYTVSAMSVPKSRISTSRVFDGWDDIPPVVCVVLEVPRKYLKGLEGLSADETGTPIFQCEIESLFHHNVFSAIHLFFGSTMSSSSDPYLLTVNEDTTRWRGNSPLIVSFYISSRFLAMLVPQTMVRLSIDPRSIGSPQIYSVLDMRLCILSADLLDKTHVQVVRGLPGNPREFPKVQEPSDTPDSQVRSVTMLTDKDSTKVDGLTGRLEINNQSLRATFRACPSSHITVKQICPFSMLVSIGQAHQEILRFPYPIDGSNSRTRLARKSSYFEVDVKLQDPNSHQDGLMINPFPMVRRNLTTIPWNIHHVNLARLPEVDTTSLRCKWLAQHLFLTFCDDTTGSTPLPKKRELIQNVKRTIRDVFSIISKYGKGHNAIVMRGTKGDRVSAEILMFIDCVRLDLPSHTIIADACAVPVSSLSDPSPETVSGSLRRAKSRVTEVQMSSREFQAWWQLLPILAERCRTWSHSSYCKFRNTSISHDVPELNISPLCECGRGKSLPSSFVTGEYKNLAPFATRVAFGPLFPVTYLDSVVSNLRKWLETMSDDPMALESCDSCGKASQSRLMKCSACGQAKYCSKECQKKHWKVHKVGCKVLNKASPSNT